MYSNKDKSVNVVTIKTSEVLHLRTLEVKPLFYVGADVLRTIELDKRL